MRVPLTMAGLGRWGVALAWAALAAGLIASASLWLETERAAQERGKLLLVQRARVIEARLAARMSTYVTALAGMAHAIDGHPGGKTAGFRRLAMRGDLARRAPGLAALLLVGGPDAAGRVLVLASDPPGGIAALGPGSDISADAALAAAIRRTDSDAAAALSPLDRPAGAAGGYFFLAAPILTDVGPVAPAPGRGGAHVVAVIDPALLLPGIVAQDDLDGPVELYDGPDAAIGAPFFRTQSSSAAGRPVLVSVPLNVQGSTWTARLAPSRALERAASSGSSYSVLVVGGVVSVLLFFSLHWLATGQSRAVSLALQLGNAARARSRRFSELARHAPLCVFIANRAGEFVFVNQRWREWCGVDGAAAAGDGWLEGVHADDRARVAATWRAAVRDGTPFHDEFRLVAPDGRERYVACSTIPERDERGEIVAHIGTSVDITPRREAELALRRANEELEARVRERTARLEALVAELGLRAKARAALNELGGVLGVCDTLEEGFNAIVRHVAGAFPHGAGCLYWFADADGDGRIVSAWGQDTVTPPALRASECWALRRGQPHHLDGASRGVACDHLYQVPAGGSVCVPVVVRGRLLAMLYWQGEPPADADDGQRAERELTWRNWAVAVGEYLALALANLTLRQTLESQVRRDPLTDLYNRRYMEEALERELHRAERSRRPMGLVMMDLDHFKQYNDTFGHHAGDLLLVALASCLRTQVRAADIVCRYGGEEFLVILPEASLDLVLQRAEHLRHAVAVQMGEVMSKERSGAAQPPVTVSIGVAVYPEHGSSATALITAADAALYRAKHRGRNRVEIAGEGSSPLPRQG